MLYINILRWEAGITSSGPCPLNKVFIDIDGVNGMCQCRDRNQLLFKGDDRCHRIYAKVFITCDKLHVTRVINMFYNLLRAPVLVVNGLSRTLTVMAFAAPRLAQQTSATGATFIGSLNRARKAAAINLSRVGRVGETVTF